MPGLDNSLYDRRAASRIIATLAFPGLFAADLPNSLNQNDRLPITFTTTPMAFEPGLRLTLAQRVYLERFMRPCPADMVTSATHRITWTDSEGVPNTGHVGPSGLGPVVAIAARETTLALWRNIAANDTLTVAIAAMDVHDRAVLAATATDRRPLAIFRVGVETTARALVQHALLAHQTPHAMPADFARSMLASGLFDIIAGSWFWGLQSSTYRRGMIPASLVTEPNGTMKYAPDGIAMLRSMKDATIAETHTVMRRATQEEGLSTDEAIQRYHSERGLIPKQYALLNDAVPPRCLAQMPNTIEGQRFTVLAGVAEAFVETFCRLLDRIVIIEQPAEPVDDNAADDASAAPIHIPDMSCTHCQTKIQHVVESLGIEVVEIDLETKQMIADFRNRAQRDLAITAIRDAGYTPTAAIPASGP